MRADDSQAVLFGTADVQEPEDRVERTRELNRLRQLRHRRRRQFAAPACEERHWSQQSHTVRTCTAD